MGEGEEAAGEDYAYDALGRLTQNRNTELGQYGYGYLGDSGQLVKAALSGSPIEYAYGYEDNAGDRLLKQTGHPRAARSYGYQRTNSLITTLTETGQGQKNTVWNFGYDPVKRLQTAKRSDGQQYGYTLDKGDNLIGIATPEGAKTYQYDAGNKNTNNRYDKNGNRIEDARHRYTWDAENRLIKIGYKNNPEKSTEFRYDGQSRRVAIIETGTTGKTETRYTWCGNVICQARDAKGKPVAYYFKEGVYRPQAKSNKKEYYARDHLGSIRDVLDETGKSVARYDYDPYGNLINKPEKQLEFGYAGMQYHAPSGLYLTKYRAYDPKDGRWLSRDPIEEAGGINAYAYVEGNPISFTDPMGLQSYMCNQAGLSAWCPPAPGSFEILKYYHDEMLRENIKGPSDNVFHCVAACKAKKNTGGTAVPRLLLDRKEESDYLRNLFGMYGEKKRLSHKEMVDDMANDRAVNETGLQCPENKSCEEQCRPYVDALQPGSRDLMKKYINSPRYNKYPG